MKASHNLWQASSAEDFIARNAAIGIHVDEILRTLTSGTQGASIMLVGSIAEGLANPQSDVDLLLLVDSEEQIDRSVDAGWSFATGEPYKPLTVKLFRHGVEYDIEVCVLEGARTLLDSVDALVNFMSAAGSAEGVQKLAVQDVRFLHQLRSGWPLANADVALTWQKRFRVQHLAVYAMINNFIGYMEYLEDVISAQSKGNMLDVANIGRICAECAAHTLLGIGGQTNPNRKWIAQLLVNLEIERPDLAPLAKVALTLLFPVASMSQEAAKEYVGDLRRLGGELRSLMSREDKMRNMFDVLFSNLHYLM